MKYAQLKYKPTNNIFKMPYADAIKFMKTDEDNYEILGMKPAKKPAAEDTGIFKQVVVDTKDKNKG